MANRYFTDILGNQNFQNGQNYVFPQKDSIFKEVYILETRILGLRVRAYLLTYFTFFVLTGFFYKSSDFLGWLIGVISIFLLLYLILFITFFLGTIILQFLNFVTFKQTFLYPFYVLVFKWYKKLFQERSKKIYYLGEGVYLIDKGNGEYRKVNYYLERIKYIKK